MALTMRMNLYISNFNSKSIKKVFLLSRPFLVCISLFALSELAALNIGERMIDEARQIVRYKRNWSRQKGFFKNKNDNNKFCILFFGNSTTVSGIIPEVLDEYGSGVTSTYNLALPVLPLAPHYFMLKDYIQNNKIPDYIFVEANILTRSVGRSFRGGVLPNYIIQNAGFIEVLHYVCASGNLHILKSYLVPSMAYKREIRNYFISKALKVLPERFSDLHRKLYIWKLSAKEKYPHNWDFVYNNRFIDHEKRRHEVRDIILKSRGYYEFKEFAIIGGKLPDDFIKPEEGDQARDHKNVQEFDPFIYRFLDLAEKEGIKVVVFNKYLMGGRLKKKNRGYLLLDSIRSINNKILFLQNSFEDCYYEPKYFSDPAHLNNRGAKEYTKNIFEGFKAILENTDGL